MTVCVFVGKGDCVRDTAAVISEIKRVNAMFIASNDNVGAGREPPLPWGEGFGGWQGCWLGPRGPGAQECGADLLISMAIHTNP